MTALQGAEVASCAVMLAAQQLRYGAAAASYQKYFGTITPIFYAEVFYRIFYRFHPFFRAKGTGGQHVHRAHGY